MLKKSNKFLFLMVICLALVSFVACSNETAPTPDPSPASNVDTTEASAITLDDLKNNLDNTEYLIVDLRKDEAYNGYKIDGISRGGHIQNAIQFTYEWIEGLDDKALEELFVNKGIVKDKTVVLYHSDNTKSNEVGAKLDTLGYENVKIFEGLKEWAEDSSLEMASLPNYHLLVYPEWVESVINGDKPETYSSDKYVILEASWGPESEAYNKAHLPGSFHFNTDNIESEPLWNISDPDIVKISLESYGITNDTAVIVYSDDVSAASRVVFALLWAGVDDVRLLNGGYAAWESAGFEADAVANVPTPVADFGVTVPQHPEYSLPMPTDVLAKQEDPNFKLVSIRSWEEYIGETSGYSYIEKAGEPKGAIWGYAGSDSGHMEDYLDVDSTYRNPLEMEGLWIEQGFSKNNQVSFYCGTGWRATVPWIMTQMMGWEDSTIFDGGWHVWVMDSTLPVQIGEPK